MELNDASKIPSVKDVTDYISELLKDENVMNVHPMTLLPQEMKQHMDKLLTSKDPDVMEAKKIFMSLFDPDLFKHNTSLNLLVVKAAGLEITPKEILRKGVKVITSNHDLLCESVHNAILGSLFHKAILNVSKYTPDSLLCNKVSTLLGDYFSSMSMIRMSESRCTETARLLCPVVSKPIEGQFIDVKDVETWIERYSLESSLDPHTLQSAIMLGNNKMKQEAEAAHEFGLNFALVRCIKKELKDFNQDKGNNKIRSNSLPVLHAFAGREEQIKETTDLFREVVKNKGVEKTINQMKNYQEKALRSLHLFATDPETCQVLENYVTSHVYDCLEKQRGMLVLKVYSVSLY